MEKINIVVVNGPNINLLGKREPKYYGYETWNAIEKRLLDMAEELDINIDFFQSNYEGDIVEFIQKNMDKFQGVIINPAAYSKNGYAILDSLTASEIPFVEVHLSNIFFRGEWHAESIFSKNAVGQIIGFKSYVYDLGMRAIVNHIKNL